MPGHYRKKNSSHTVPHVLHRQVLFVLDKSSFENPDSSLNEEAPFADGLSSAHHYLRIPL